MSESNVVCVSCGRPFTEGVEQEVIPPRRSRGQPSKFSNDTANRICGLIAQGLSLKAICELEDMPDTTTVYEWRRVHPSFSLAYAQAREDAADAFADEILAIADASDDDWKWDETTNSWKPQHDIVNRAKLRVDSRKWIASKLKPSTFGDRIEARLSGTVTTANINIDASQMTLEARQLLRAAILPQLRPAVEEDED